MNAINDLILNFGLQVVSTIGLVSFGMQLQKQLQYTKNKRQNKK